MCVCTVRIMASLMCVHENVFVTVVACTQHVWADAVCMACVRGHVCVMHVGMCGGVCVWASCQPIQGNGKDNRCTYQGQRSGV